MPSNIDADGPKERVVPSAPRLNWPVAPKIVTMSDYAIALVHIVMDWVQE